MEVELQPLQNQQKKFDWIKAVCWILIISSIAYIFYYYYLEKVDVCTSDPLKFGINKIKDSTNAEIISGHLRVVNSYGNVIDHYFGDEWFNETAWSNMEKKDRFDLAFGEVD